jgi:hypothetical protein
MSIASNLGGGTEAGEEGGNDRVGIVEILFEKNVYCTVWLPAEKWWCIFALESTM